MDRFWLGNGEMRRLIVRQEGNKSRGLLCCSYSGAGEESWTVYLPPSAAATFNRGRIEYSLPPGNGVEDRGVGFPTRSSLPPDSLPVKLETVAMQPEAMTDGNWKWLRES
jgi:hypothetical protein